MYQIRLHNIILNPLEYLSKYHAVDIVFDLQIHRPDLERHLLLMLTVAVSLLAGSTQHAMEDIH